MYRSLQIAKRSWADPVPWLKVTRVPNPGRSAARVCQAPFPFPCSLHPIPFQNTILNCLRKRFSNRGPKACSSAFPSFQHTVPTYPSHGHFFVYQNPQCPFQNKKLSFLPKQVESELRIDAEDINEKGHNEGIFARMVMKEL